MSPSGSRVTPQAHREGWGRSGGTEAWRGGPEKLDMSNLPWNNRLLPATVREAPPFLSSEILWSSSLSTSWFNLPQSLLPNTVSPLLKWPDRDPCLLRIPQSSKQGTLKKKKKSYFSILMETINQSYTYSNWAFVYYLISGEEKSYLFPAQQKKNRHCGLITWLWRENVAWTTRLRAAPQTPASPNEASGAVGVAGLPTPPASWCPRGGRAFVIAGLVTTFRYLRGGWALPRFFLFLSSLEDVCSCCF